ncbi:MAG: MerR family transcriptional regulator [Synechococcaceae cyanobacterium]|nr:MerR family transcriptional regulator [Synechococcaceae cyanobacterium]
MPVPLVMPPLKIGAVARRSGLSVKTIRFYCDEGLIQPFGRSEGGYRLFDDEVFAELALIRTLRAMELPLPDVRRILEARRSGVCTCSDLKARLRSKAGEIGEKITAMQNLQTELFDLLNSWEACGGRPATPPTPVRVAAEPGIRRAGSPYPAAPARSAQQAKDGTATTKIPPHA